MMQKVATLILALVAIFCLGYGITGFAVLSTESLCTEDIDCQYSKCCPLFEQDYGVCAAETQCDEIYFSSVEESGLYRAPSDIGQDIEKNYIAIVLGIVMLMILVIVGYFEWKHENSQKKGRKRVKK